MNRLLPRPLLPLDLPVPTRAQGRPAPVHGSESTAADFYREAARLFAEPFVIEQYFTTARFENDGTGERVVAVKRARSNRRRGAAVEPNCISLQFRERTN